MDGGGAVYENFYKRLVAFLVGGLVAMIVQLFIYPVRARDRLVQSLSASVRQVQKMHAALAVGIDGPVKPNFRSPVLHKRFGRARDKARHALTAAETILPYCLKEPRIKGSFKPLAPIYREIIYVLHQIIDRMDNVVQLRNEYGSSVLEDLNPQVYAYRRNVASSSMLVLFSVNEALTTWLPLPQFIPSTRLAHLRLVNRVRQLLLSRSTAASEADLATGGAESEDVKGQTADVIAHHRFLSWNASAAGEMEIIEYLEELVELTKLLVGVNAFRSGLLETTSYRHYMQRVTASPKSRASALLPSQSLLTARRASGVSGTESLFEGTALRLRRTMTASAGHLGHTLGGDTAEEAVESESDSEDEIPMSLQRVGTRTRLDNAFVRRRFTHSGVSNS